MCFFATLHGTVYHHNSTTMTDSSVLIEHAKDPHSSSKCAECDDCSSKDEKAMTQTTDVCGEFLQSFWSGCGVLSWLTDQQI